MKTSSKALFAIGATVLTAACGSVDSEPTTENAPPRAAVEIRQNLGPGDKGPDVAAVTSTLSLWGYLPNETLAARNPNWTPSVPTAPKDPSFYGSELEEAVSLFQTYLGFERTGRVDAQTLEALQATRCSEPDNVKSLDPSEKWGPFVTNTTTGWSKWSTNNIRFKITGSSPAGASTALANALAAWNAQSFLNLTVTTGSTFDVEVKFWGCTVQSDASVVPGCPFKATTNVPSGWQEFQIFPNPNGGANTAQVFQTSPPLASGMFNRIGANTNQTNFSTVDLQSTFEHEVGHILGFAHSQNVNNPFGSCTGNTGNSTTCPVMWPFLNANVQRRTLRGDDLQALSLFYNQWNLKSGVALDVAAGGSSASPKIYATSSGNTLFFFTPSTNPPWTQIDADAVAIAVDDNGFPWAVSSDGTIWQGSDTDPTSFFFTWNPMSFNSAANDIGASGGQVWIISKTPAGSQGNFAVQQLVNGNTWSSANGGSGKRITVDWAGRPWVVQTNPNAVWRRYGDNDTIDQKNGPNVSWRLVSQANPPNKNQLACGNDIGAGADHSVWLVGCNASGSNFGMWIWDEQVASTKAPSEAQFLAADGSAVRVAGSPDGRAWTVQANGNMFRRSINSQQQ